MAVFSEDRENGRGESTQLQHHVKSFVMSRKMQAMDTTDNGSMYAPSLEDLDTEEKRIEFLQELSTSLKKCDRKVIFKEPSSLFEIISRSLSDVHPLSRNTALNILCEIIPDYGVDLDKQMNVVFLPLVQNLLHSNSSVKKATLQTLHLYFKNSKDMSVIVEYLVLYGFDNPSKAVRNELLMSMPVFLRTGFSEDNLRDIFVTIVRIVSKMDEHESTLPAVLCFDHIGQIFGSGFDSFLLGLPPTIYTVYKRTMKNSSMALDNHKFENDKQSSDGLSSSGNSLVDHNTDLSDTYEEIHSRLDTQEEPVLLLFGFVPSYIITRLDDDSNWKSRSQAMDELCKIVDQVSTPFVMIPHIEQFFSYISKFVEDVNFKVIHRTLTTIFKVVLKVGLHIRPNMEAVIEILVSKLGDPKVVIRQVNNDIALALMRNLSPSTVLNSFLTYIRHKSARVREEVINLATRALLEFPSAEFDLDVLPAKVAPMLLDSKRRVRQAVLECLAVLAQQLGQGKLHPLVTAVDKVEIQPGGDGALIAVQARLSRRMLPRVTSDGVIEYALTNSNATPIAGDHPPDIAWILAGSSGSLNDSMRQTAGNLDSPSRSGSLRRYYSAGKKKLPWQKTDQGQLDSNMVRKSVASAPVQHSVSFCCHLFFLKAV